MKNKTFLRAILLLAFALLLQPLAAFAATESAEYYYLTSLQKTTFLPSTIYSGDIVSVAFDIKNRGSTLSIKDLNAYLDLGDQFEPVSSSSGISLISPQATKTVVLKFKVKEDTISGYYPVLLKMSYLRDGALVEESQSIQVPVSKAEAKLEVTVKPNVIGPGNQTKIAFVIENTGANPVSNVSFSWSESGNLVLPLGSNNKKYIPAIGAGSSVEVEYIVGTDPGMATGIYPLDVSITFNDTNGQKTQASQVGIIIGGTTDFEISAEKQSTGQISISIANIGSNNAASVVVKIPQQQGIIINGSSSAILGSINKGDYTIANFQVQQSAFEPDLNSGRRFSGAGAPSGMPQGNPDRNFQMPQASPDSMIVQIDYTDTTGERQSVQKKIALSSISSSTTALPAGRTQGNSSQSLIYWALLAAAVIATAVFDKIKGKLSWKKMAAIWLATATAFFAVSMFLSANLIAGIAIAIVSFGLVFWLSARQQKRENEAKANYGERRK